MQPLKDETQAAILKDEFAFKSIEAAILVIYAQNRDWSRMRRDGKPMFESEEAAIAYSALCVLIGREEPPTMDGTKVNVGGQLIDASAVQILESSLSEHAREKAAAV